MNVRSLNVFPRPKPTSLTAANHGRVSGVLFTSLTVPCPSSRPLGCRRWDWGPSVSQHPEKINNSQCLTPEGNRYDSILVAVEVKECHHLSAS